MLRFFNISVCVSECWIPLSSVSNGVYCSREITNVITWLLHIVCIHKAGVCVVCTLYGWKLANSYLPCTNINANLTVCTHCWPNLNILHLETFGVCQLISIFKISYISIVFRCAGKIKTFDFHLHDARTFKDLWLAENKVCACECAAKTKVANFKRSTLSLCFSSSLVKLWLWCRNCCSMFYILHV